MIGNLIGNGLGYAMLGLAVLACGSSIALGIVGFLRNASLPPWPGVAPGAHGARAAHRLKKLIASEAHMRG